MTGDQKTVIGALAASGMTAMQVSQRCHVTVTQVLDVAVPHLAGKGWTAGTIALGLAVNTRQISRRLEQAA